MPSHKKLLVATFSALLLLLIQISGVGELSLGIELAYAQTGAKSPSETAIQTMLTGLSVAFNFLIFLTFLVLKFVAVLLDPEFFLEINETAVITDSSGNPIGPILNVIWQISRNIVNIIFAFLLVFAALYTVVTANREMVKNNIAKFVIAIILVNFSWFFPRVVIDVANVLTASIYSLTNVPPLDQLHCKMRDEGGEITDVDCKYVKHVILFPDQDKSYTTGSGGSDEFKTECQKEKSTDANIRRPINEICVVLGELDNETNTGLGILNGILVNHAQILHITNLRDFRPDDSVGVPGPYDEIKYFLSFLMTLLFLVIYAIAMFFPIVALGVVFFLRIPILWMTIAFMPFMFVGFVLGEKMSEKFNTMNLIWGHFWRAAFLPVVTAIPLTVGFIILKAGMTSSCPTESLISETLCEPTSSLMGGVQTYWQLLWNFTALVIMWSGFFAAMSIDSIYESVGNSIKGVGEAWGKFAMKAPLAAAVVPMPGGGKASVLQVAKAAGRPEQILAPGGALTSLEQIGKNIAGGAKFQPGNAETNKKIQDIASNNADALHKDMQQLINAVRSNNITASTRATAVRVKQELQNRGLDEANIPALARGIDSSFQSNQMPALKDLIQNPHPGGGGSSTP